jgi:hypothetical protein
MCRLRTRRSGRRTARCRGGSGRKRSSEVTPGDRWGPGARRGKGLPEGLPEIVLPAVDVEVPEREEVVVPLIHERDGSKSSHLGQGSRAGDAGAGIIRLERDG